MKSNIINMAEKMTDKDDLFLRELFASAPIADDGFSQRIVARVRRQLWLERLTLPTAVIVGAVFAVKPISQIVEMLVRLLPAEQVLQIDLPTSSLSALLSTQNLLLGGLAFLAAVLAYQFVED